MRNDFIFSILKNRHNQLIELAAQCPEDKRNIVPEGFKNSLHWHIGHVLTVTEFHVFDLSEFELNQKLPASYQDFFAYGTKPADWQGEPPAWDVLIGQLRKQPDEIRELLEGKLDVPVKENFLKAETFGELIVSTVQHAAEHIGFVSAMLKALK
ncbi:DinB family protein [Paenibacillus radicis (ex Gao et al. 2016)]|uniref:Formate dehydrogenase n=1 Tax=Paenibacillus radicis (ex Gao et al. 2016) TaxID=1737354 RepID=A0A917LRA0_9BACL|nr:DinB family protein [Paenibacillus radicis (ex Gao et al. 2016)]GGG52877.1 formate dehydrogenase [Paenibacillus radicis (ex Gao et al. 2016)]